MFCSKCGKEIMDEAVICPHCGCPVSGKSLYQSDSGEDIPNAGLNILGFLVPLAGLIMFCSMLGKTPIKAKQIGIFSLIGFVINFILVMLMFM